MKIVTLKQFLTFRPCYTEKQIKAIAGDKAEWSAMDVLNLDDIPAADRLWAVLREEFIPAEILHEFACRCAEMALALVENPDPRSTSAIAAKRAWLRGEITAKELGLARDAAYATAAAARDAADAAARDAAYFAAAAARDATAAAARDAAYSAADAAHAAADAYDNQISTLKSMLEEAA